MNSIAMLRTEWQEETKKLVEDFRSSVIQEDSLANNFCFAITYPLSILLYHNGDGVIHTGGLCKGNVGDALHHFWIRDGLNSELIIDPTASQFPGLPEVNYKLDKKNYTASILPINWIDVYDGWAYPLKNDGLKRPSSLEPYKKEYEKDYKRIQIANYRAASFALKFLIEKVPILLWNDHFYFDTICTSLFRLLQNGSTPEILALPEVQYLIKEFKLTNSSEELPQFN